MKWLSSNRPDPLAGRLWSQEQKLDHILERLRKMSVTLDRATASLEKLNNAATAIEKVLDMVVAEVKATGTDDPKVLAALDAIDAKSDEIVAKALANTPAADQVTTDPAASAS